MNQVRILQHLGKEKALLKIIVSASIWLIHIIQLCESTSHHTIIPDGHKGIPRPITVLLIASRAIGVVETLDDFRTEIVVAVRDIETCFLVESGFVSGWRRVIRVVCCSVLLDPAEHFGSDASECADVGVVAAVDEGEAEVDVFLLFEDKTTKDEGTAVKTGDWAC